MPSASHLGPIDIEIECPPNAPFKSIDHIVWKNIPPFAVLTGTNGTGKSQLLQLLAHSLTNTGLPPSHPNIRAINVKITGDSFGPESVAYVQSENGPINQAQLSIDQLQGLKQGLYDNIRSYGGIVGSSLRARLFARLGITELGGLTREQFFEKIPNDFDFMLDENDLIHGLCHVFLAYRLRAVQMLEKAVPENEIKEELGIAPWEFIDQSFEAARFPYRTIDPRGFDLTSPTQILFRDEKGMRLTANDFSSGEKALLRLVYWLYRAKRQKVFPRLFLLDEPDAHLHPSLTQQLISVLKDVLVDQHHIRVILTTHSPSTVALAPEDAVFEMSREQPRIRKSASKSEAINLLTAGLVTVSAGTRFVLVEDQNDVDFYGMVREILTDWGPAKDEMALNPSPTIAFLPASTGASSSKTGGGCSVVRKWVEKFDEPPLSDLIRGIIDHDMENVATSRIEVLERYSIENYLLDPFVVFVVALDAGKASPISGISIGNEHLLRSLTEEALQPILAFVENAMAPALGPLAETEMRRTRVSFTNGVQIEYPEWMLSRRGHDLLPLFQSVFGGARTITPLRLANAFRRVRLIPRELAEIMRKLQN